MREPKERKLPASFKGTVLSESTPPLLSFLRFSRFAHSLTLSLCPSPFLSSTRIDAPIPTPLSRLPPFLSLSFSLTLSLSLLLILSFPHLIPMPMAIRPLPVLEDYDISPVTGFLPAEEPLEILEDPYFAPWEDTFKCFNGLLLASRLRQRVQEVGLFVCPHSVWTLSRHCPSSRLLTYCCPITQLLLLDSTISSLSSFSLCPSVTLSHTWLLYECKECETGKKKKANNKAQPLVGVFEPDPQSLRVTLFPYPTPSLSPRVSVSNQWSNGDFKIAACP